MRIHELPAKLRERGLTVREVAGWETRGNEFPTRPDGALRHWDAIGSKAPTAGLGVITNGRPDLAGPLAQVYQSRYTDANGLDIVYVVASGKANHAGAGEWNGISGNYNLLGVEIAWSGPSEPFPAKRKLTSELVMRALLDCCAGTNPNDVAEHREYAKPAGRKIDTNLDGNELRRRMVELNQPAPALPPSIPRPSGAKDRLRSGESMRPGESLTSNTGWYRFAYQGDGNLVVYVGFLSRPSDAIWQSRTNGKRTSRLSMQSDGNLVLYDDNKAVWHTGTHGHPGAYVVMQGDGNLVIYHGNRAIWGSKQGGRI
jgi:hypothetical protein